MKKFLISFGITGVIGFILFFIFLPALNPSSFGFWFFLLVLLGIFILLDLIVHSKGIHLKMSSFSKYSIIGLILILIAIVVFDLINSPMLRASSYANRIVVDQTNDFYAEIEEVNFNHLPLLDKTSSQKLGDRVMGQLPELVSQFYVSDVYTQINYNNDIIRVTPLEYDGLVKYMNNRKNGVKGYITVNSVTGESNLVKLNDGMKYMPSAFLMENVYRHVRFHYPTEIFTTPSFELDNEGNPYWIFPTVRYAAINLRPDISGVIMCDPITGKTTKYAIDEVPRWIDHVYPAELIIDQVDDWGLYNNGFFNSIFGQKNVVQTTDGYNYLIQNDDVYLYTGITSIAADESNLGFILSNLRTKETNFYSVPGAEEYSAMASAQGQVQQMNYRASFPLLINLNGKATYLISLKDNAGLVKMYAFVDVADYQKVCVTESSQGIEKAARNYLQMDGSNGNIEIEYETKQGTIRIQSVKEVTIQGTTYYYFTTDTNDRYRVSIIVDEANLPFMTYPSTIDMEYYSKDNINEITKIISIKKEDIQEISNIE